MLAMSPVPVARKKSPRHKPPLNILVIGHQPLRRAHQIRADIVTLAAFPTESLKLVVHIAIGIWPRLGRQQLDVFQKTFEMALYEITREKPVERRLALILRHVLGSCLLPKQNGASDIVENLIADQRFLMSEPSAKTAEIFLLRSSLMASAISSVAR